MEEKDIKDRYSILKIEGRHILKASLTLSNKY